MNFLTKFAVSVASVGAGLLAIGSQAFATATYITLPEGAVATLTAYAGALFTDLWVVIALAIGLPLAFYVIRKVVSLVRVH
jgi:hypothetical protein